MPILFSGMYATQDKIPLVSTVKHYYGLNHSHFITHSAYRRVRLFDSERFKNRWVATLGDRREELGFRIIGYVLMPEHFHLLIWPREAANPSQIMQKLENRTALFILGNLRENLRHPWREKMLARVRLPPSVHHHAHFRVGQRRCHDMNIGTPKKRDEKLNYMQNNPVKRPGDWPWSSWQFYFLHDRSQLAMDRMR